MSKTLFTDVEVYRNYFFIGIKRWEDQVTVGFEMSSRCELDRKRLRRVMLRNRIITHNGMTYDMPIIWLAIQGASNDDLKRASDRIIKGNLKWWDVERALGVSIPKVDHIDLIEPNPAVFAGLKTTNGRLHGKRMQDLPFDPDAVLTHEQMDITGRYCLNDLDATEREFEALQEPIKLREELGAIYDMDLRSKSDAQVGEAIIKKRYESLVGERPRKVEAKPGTVFRYQVPEFFKFRSKQMQDVITMLRETEFVIKADGKVDMPKQLRDLKIRYGDTEYAMGIGGLHSTEANRSVHTDEDHVLVDADVASQYPSIIMKLGLFPQSLGKTFLSIYGSLIKDRLEAKKSGDKVRDKAGKIALNGAYGKLGSRYSVLYAPHLLIAVTLTGQLSLLLLIEMAESAGIPVVSGNTDGVMFRVPRSKFTGFLMKDDGKPSDRLAPGPLASVIDEWERITGFKMESAEYRALYNQSVNSYIAILASGKVKRKGPLGNPWSDRPGENDLRGQLMKNPQAFICSDAVVNFLVDGTPIERTIRECRDIRAFVTVVAATGGATWRDEYLGKVVRYVWSTDGDPIIKVKPHPSTGNRPKVPKTDGCRPMMLLPDEFPGDLDYDRYIAEARSILKEIGYTERSEMSPWFKFLSDLLRRNKNN